VEVFTRCGATIAESPINNPNPNLFRIFDYTALFRTLPIANFPHSASRILPKTEPHGHNNNNNNDNNHNNVYGAVIMTYSHCESSPGLLGECRVSAGWPPTLRPNQLIWAVSPPKDWLLPSTDTIAIYYYYSARKLLLILPSHGGCKSEST